MLRRLQAAGTSGNLLTEMRQIIYSLYRVKKITKKVTKIVRHLILIDYY